MKRIYLAVILSVFLHPKSADASISDLCKKMAIRFGLFNSIESTWKSVQSSMLKEFANDPQFKAEYKRQKPLRSEVMNEHAVWDYGKAYPVGHQNNRFSAKQVDQAEKRIQEIFENEIFTPQYREFLKRFDNFYSQAIEQAIAKLDVKDQIEIMRRLVVLSRQDEVGSMPQLSLPPEMAIDLDFWVAPNSQISQIAPAVRLLSKIGSKEAYRAALPALAFETAPSNRWEKGAIPIGEAAASILLKSAEDSRSRSELMEALKEYAAELKAGKFPIEFDKALTDTEGVAKVQQVIAKFTATLASRATTAAANP
jgi:hypothetical protein